MQLPDFIDALPRLELPVPDEVIETRVVRSDSALAAFFIAHQTFELPEHSHKGQWGTVLEGQLDLTIEGALTVHTPGSSYNIPSGAVHKAKVHAGSVVFDVFEEPDRYPIRD